MQLVTTALIACTLLVAPVLSSAADQPPPADGSNQAVAVVHDGGDSIMRSGSSSLSMKRARTAEEGEYSESVDCFYEENKAEKDCRGIKSGTR